VLVEERTPLGQRLACLLPLTLALVDHRQQEETGRLGHAGVSGFTMPPGGYLSFLVEPEGERFVAFRSDRTGFLADGFPYLTKIDGKDVADW
jgi:hypothetical protein